MAWNSVNRTANPFQSVTRLTVTRHRVRRNYLPWAPKARIQTGNAGYLPPRTLPAAVCRAAGRIGPEPVTYFGTHGDYGKQRQVQPGCRPDRVRAFWCYR